MRGEFEGRGGGSLRGEEGGGLWLTVKSRYSVKFQGM